MGLISIVYDPKGDAPNRGVSVWVPGALGALNGINKPTRSSRRLSRDYEKTGTSGFRRFGGGGGSIELIGAGVAGGVNADVEVVAEEVGLLLSNWDSGVDGDGVGSSD